MLRDKDQFEVASSPLRAEKSGRSVGLIGSGFMVGAFISFLGFGSIIGVAPLDLLAGSGLGPLRSQKTPSERLIVQGSVIDIAKKAQPSVVGIQTHGDRAQAPSVSGGPQADSVGSGVIIRPDGYIMTNSHVVGDAAGIIVTLDDEKVPAKVIGADQDTDIAVIKVDRKELPVAVMGSAEDLEVGELAVAIGSPFGFQHSVTAGVISALNRNVTVGTEADRPRTYTNLIQTDAAINPGNSGGALINRDGEVIGINTLIYSTNGVSQGIGFAIPVEEAKSIAENLVDEGRVSHSFIGVEGQTLAVGPDADSSEVSQGAHIAQVTPGGPADGAGVRPGDIVVGFNDAKITTMDDLVAAVRGTVIDDTVPIDIIRGGIPQQLTVRIRQRPGSF